MILVCGEALFDLFEESGENDDVDYGVPYSARPGGSPFNISIGLSRMGGKSALLAAISTDPFGARLRNVLQREKVESKFLVETKEATTLSVVSLNKEGEPNYAFYGRSDRSVTVNDIGSLPETVKGLHFGSYPIVVEPISSVCEMLLKRETHRFISFDPNVRLSVAVDIDLWRNKIDLFRRGSDIIKVSDEDLLALYPDRAPVDVARSWLSGRTALVVLTQGGGEAVCFGKWGEIRVAPPKVTVIDTVGAGDTFHAALIAPFSHVNNATGMLNSLTRDDALIIVERAAKAAAINCTRRGFDAPFEGELDSI